MCCSRRPAPRSRACAPLPRKSCPPSTESRWPSPSCEFTTETQRARREEVQNLSPRDPLTERVIGLAIGVHRELGPGLLESAYEECLCFELRQAGIGYSRQEPLAVISKVSGSIADTDWMS